MAPLAGNRALDLSTVLAGPFCSHHLAHAWEQMGQGGRNKGPTPPAYRWRYDGPTPLSEGEDGA